MPDSVHGCTSEAIVSRVRTRITTGEYPAGSPIRDGALAKEFNVSRNTARESLSLLRHAGLLVQEPNRGFFVRTFGIEELKDLYRARRVFEIRAVQESQDATAEALARVEASVVRAETAPADEGWADAVEHSMSFHRAIVGLLGSPLLDEFYLNLLARLSTTFSRSAEPGKYHSHWANPHRDILDRITSGDRHGAEGLLRIHLDDSEASTLDLARSVGEGY
ncbi:DNA-binding GntR family transcriptional regulator [Brevibacterium sanguinis]|uniref:DNA-binding GntR family transcriptional regulator n=2 Tax=Brevibacterium TaxID=1696 RepID=A0A366IMS5_9MICO|nr:MULTISPECIES: GntR family transcriptional regulator [Brevibacterium]RBP68218.1 DNA-binding GntR family transcriptional regulator [Brevibacterium sanguinis]RBP74365.1 DNA-binding GntR family transcriptional regulator [Brevibacterium celere]